MQTFKGKHGKQLVSQSLLTYWYSVDLPFRFELYQKSFLSLAKPLSCYRSIGSISAAFLSLVYVPVYDPRGYYVFLCFYQSYDAWCQKRQQTVCKRSETREEKYNCRDWASLRQAGKIFARAGGIPSGSWICPKHRNKSKRQTMFISIVMGEYLKTSQITDRKPSVPGLWSGEKIFSKLQTWNKLMHWMQSWGGQQIERARKIHIPQKRKTYNKRKIEYFLTFIRASSRWTSYNKNKYTNNKENVLHRMRMTNTKKNNVLKILWPPAPLLTHGQQMFASNNNRTLKNIFLSLRTTLLYSSI